MKITVLLLENLQSQRQTYSTIVHSSSVKIPSIRHEGQQPALSNSAILTFQTGSKLQVEASDDEKK